MTDKPMRKDTAAVEQAVQDVIWLGKNGAWRGVAAVLAERRRQIELSYDVPHDKGHEPGWLARQACVAAALGSYMAEQDPNPEIAVDECAKAGALSMAEIDRLPWFAALPADKAS
jgi:hypothetical protein